MFKSIVNSRIFGFFLILSLIKTSVSRADDFRPDSREQVEIQSSDSLTMSEALEAMEKKHPAESEKIINQYVEFIRYADEKILDKKISLGKDVLEIGKTVGMSVLAAVMYGIFHDLITTHVDFDYFASDRTHHGPVTRMNFPFVYQSQSKILYALLWGTIATWWVGLPIGGLSGIVARVGSEGKKLSWRDLIKPAGVMLAANLATALAVGGVKFLITRNTFQAVAKMHTSSYLLGAVGGIGLIAYAYEARFTLPPELKSQREEMAKDIFELFKQYPDDLAVQGVVNRFLSISW